MSNPLIPLEMTMLRQDTDIPETPFEITLGAGAGAVTGV